MKTIFGIIKKTKRGERALGYGQADSVSAVLDHIRGEKGIFTIKLVPYDPLKWQ